MKKYNRRTILNTINTRYVNCMCDCWTIKKVNIYHLKDWSSKSCWCLRKETTVKRNTTHWMNKTRFYITRCNMQKRCNDLEDKLYWWRWIKVLRKKFIEFKKDMYGLYNKHLEKYWKKNTSIDRINVNWNYCKENCRRATIQEQSENKRNKIMIQYKWIIKSQTERSKELWIPMSTIHRRLKKWLSTKKVLSKHGYFPTDKEVLNLK